MGAKQWRCHVCGCTDNRRCRRGGVACYWVDENLCSMCASVSDVISSPRGYAWLLMLLAGIAMNELEEPAAEIVISPNRIDGISELRDQVARAK